MTLMELLERAPGDATAIALPENDIRLTYREVLEQVWHFASILSGTGIARGDRVAIALGNGFPAVVSILAASTVGTAAPLNPAYRQDEFEFYLEDIGAKLLVVPEDGAEEARAAARGRIPIVTVVVDEAGKISAEGGMGPAALTTPNEGDVALILHTSGSTGRPKRVPLSHRNLTISAQHVVASYELTAEDVSLCVMPLFHIHGLVAATFATFWSCGTIVMPIRFNPLSFWRIVREYDVTWYSAVPTIHQLLLTRAEVSKNKPAGVEGLRFIRSCSAPLSPEILDRIEEKFETPVLEAYGMTEAAHQMSSNPLPPKKRKSGSVGFGTGVDIRVTDNDGKDKAVGERGEIVIRGENVIDGYENNPGANANSFFGDWFRTGDQGFLDRDGYLTLTGRLKELINRGGEKISPREVDEVLLGHPFIAEAVAFGVPHKDWGEEVEAAVVIVAEVTEDEIVVHCRQSLADFKVPKKIHIVSAIPKTATGKIQRRIVAEQFIEN